MMSDIKRGNTTHEKALDWSEDWSRTRTLTARLAKTTHDTLTQVARVYKFSHRREMSGDTTSLAAEGFWN